MTKSHSWNYNFALLKEYLVINFKYPKIGEIYKECNLGTWVNNIRTIYNHGDLQTDGSYKYGSYTLTKEQIDTLNTINFQWKKLVRNQDSWETKYNLLKEFTEVFNRFPKQAEKYKGVNLGTWLSAQRNAYKNGDRQEDGTYIYQSIKLTNEKIRLLKDINFEFDIDVSRNNFDNNINLLIEFVKLNKRYPKGNEMYKGFNLGLWTTRLKRIFNNGKTYKGGTIKYGNMILTKEYINRLNEIGFPWVNNVGRYNNTPIKNSNDYKRKLEYLKLKLEKLLDEENNDIKSYKDIKKLNRKYSKCLNYKLR